MIDRAWQQDEITFGLGGMDIRRSIDKIPDTHLAIMKNVVRMWDGSITARPGMRALTSPSGGTNVHSIARFDDPANNTYTRVLGVDSSVYVGQSVLSLAATGFSGKRLSMIPFRPELSSEAWMIISDTQKMIKLRRDGLVMPLGMPPPANAMLTTALPGLRKDIDAFDDAASWTLHSGTATASKATVAGKSGNAVAFTVGTAAGDGFFDKAVGVDLSTFGTQAISDSDLVHLWMKVQDPARVIEAKLYFICSNFTAGTLPGTSSTLNTDAFMKVFRPSEFVGTIGGTTTTTDAADDYITREYRDRNFERIADDRESVEIYTDSEPSRSVTVRVPETTVWQEYGSIGLPLRRGDFERIGTDTTRGWDTITGVCIWIKTSDTTGTVVTLDDLYIHGGYGPDTTELGSMQYDYVYTNYDPRTGAESNPSPASEPFDATRQRIQLTPDTYGDTNIRQRFYRRGGTLTDTWYYIGANTADGVDIYDTFTDLEISAAGAVWQDHDLPVTSTAPDGSAVYGTNLSSISGPLGGAYIFGCGDPYRKGAVYYCKAYEPDHWPSENFVECAPPSEELLAVLMYNNQGYALSRKKPYQLVLNLTGTDTVITALPLPCGHGLAGRNAWAVGPEIYFVSTDGIYATSGGIERNLTDDFLAPLFHRSWDLREGSPTAIDWEAEDDLLLEVFENELYFTYTDINGVIQTLVYNLLDNQWRWYTFSVPPKCLYAETSDSTSQLLIGGANGIVYTHSGESDNTLPISCQIRTGMRNQGMARNDKSYGDLSVDLITSSEEMIVTTYLGPTSTYNQSTNVVANTRSQLRCEHFPTTQLSRGCAVDFTWSSSSNRPVLHGASLSYILEPERIGMRPTDWSDCGNPGFKFFKNLILECNTFGVNKELIIEGDGSIKSTITIHASGRQQLEVSFPPFQAKLVRIRSANTNDLILYPSTVQWVYEELPMSLTSWEYRPEGYGIFGYQVHYDGYITLNSTAPVTLSLTFDETYLQTYTIPSTGGIVQKIYIKFLANKSLLTSYKLESTTPFMIHRDDTFLRLFPWGKGESVIFKPFGGANQGDSARS